MTIKKAEYLLPGDWRETLLTDITLGNTDVLQLTKSKPGEFGLKSVAISLVRNLCYDIVTVVCDVLEGDRRQPTERKLFEGKDGTTVALEYRAQRIMDYDSLLFKE